MIEDWESAIAFTFRMEGGETVEWDPNDPGGQTKFGISKKAYPSLDIAALTLEEAKAIYRRDFWQACKCDELPRAFAIGLFDSAVNQGVGQAIRILQVTLNTSVDGIIGPKTIAAAYKATTRDVKLFLAERLAAYSRLAADKQNLLRYARNWAFRVISLSELILQSGAAA